MRICRTCCYPDTKPDLIFDESGQCSACSAYEARPTIHWGERLADLRALIKRHGNRCVVASSGGKDSSYIALRMKELGADVTCVTATTCHLTSLGRHNIDNLARHVRTIEVTPNMTVRAKLNRIGLETVGDISWPEHASIFAQPFRYAKATNHTLIMYGENPQNQYGGPLGSADALQMTKRWTTEFGGFLGLRASDMIGQEGISTMDMLDYMFPPDIDGIEAHFLGQYEPWDSHRNARVAAMAGMIYTRPVESNWWAWENLDNAQTWVHDHLMWLKYGFSRGCGQISVDVRSGLIRREAALLWLAEHKPQLGRGLSYLNVSYDTMLDRIGMTDEQLQGICARFTNKEIHGRLPDHPRDAVQGLPAGEGPPVRE